MWGHAAEILPYWMGQVRRVIAGGPDDPVPFGRTPSDPGRLGGIERGTREPAAALMAEITDAIAELSRLLRSIDEAGWASRGRHPTLGDMDIERIVEDYMVGHLEAHADQLDGRQARRPNRPL